MTHGREARRHRDHRAGRSRGARSAATPADPSTPDRDVPAASTILARLSVLLIAAALGTGTGIALAVLTAFSIGMTGSAVPTVMPVVYATVVGAAALPGQVAASKQ
ncbi:hypothetical protein ACIA8E_27830 [Streptomyces sp. NPDC051664]|uniref:hypothetical protein n=1 Tax=Streptomyces sp. NPDC051664 TaxID=3365668 RepID=UPI0037B43F0F